MARSTHKNHPHVQTKHNYVFTECYVAGFSTGFSCEHYLLFHLSSCVMFRHTDLQNKEWTVCDQNNEEKETGSHHRKKIEWECSKCGVARKKNKKKKT